jgi:hypothetical protein
MMKISGTSGTGGFNRRSAAVSRRSIALLSGPDPFLDRLHSRFQFDVFDHSQVRRDATFQSACHSGTMVLLSRSRRRRSIYTVSTVLR